MKIYEDMINNPNFNKTSLWAEIDLNALEHNFKLIKNMVKNTIIIPIVKANAYGHGIVEVSKFLINKFKIKYLGVARINEGILLRKNGVCVPIIILGGFLKEESEYVLKYNLEPSIFIKDEIIFLSKVAAKLNKKINIHIKINTGMNRLGVKPEEGFEVIELVKKLKNLNLKSIYTHLANADIYDEKFTLKQHNALLEIKNKIKDCLFHEANSAAILKYPFTYLDAVRPGIMLYGSFMDKKIKNKIGLKPVMTIKSKIVNIINLKKGDIVSYGGTYKAKNKERIAIISIGYGDGLRRELSNKWYVMIKGKKVRIIGRICMDLTAIKLPFYMKDVKIGDEVLILGKDEHGKIEVEDMAKELNTISYEIFTGISERVPRIFKYKYNDG